MLCSSAGAMSSAFGPMNCPQACTSAEYSGSPSNMNTGVPSCTEMCLDLDHGCTPQSSSGVSCSSAGTPSTLCIDIGSVIDHEETNGLPATIDWLMINRPDATSNKDAIRKSIQRLLTRYKNLKKSKSRADGQKALTEFRSTEFPYPKARDLDSDGPKKSGSRMTASFTIGKNLEQAIEQYQSIAHHFAKENVTLKSSLQETENKVKDREVLSLELKCQDTKLKNVTNLLRAKDLESSEKQKVINEQNSTISNIATDNETLTSRLNRKEAMLKRTRQREQHHRAKSLKLDESCGKKSEDVERVNELLLASEEKVQQLQNLIIEMGDEMKTLQEQVAELEREEVNTLEADGKTYNADTQKCVYQLLQHHVGSTQIGPVIGAVLKLANKTATSLPCKSSVNNMNVQRLVVSQKQLAEEFSSKKNTTHYTDETSKFGEKYMGYHGSDDSGRFWVLGLRDISTKSASDTLDTFKQVLNDIETYAENATTPVAKQILVNTKNLMSDRAATEVKYNRLFEEHRAEILPQLIEG